VGGVLLWVVLVVVDSGGWEGQRVGEGVGRRMEMKFEQRLESLLQRLFGACLTPG
jgi:hypothetical protein